LSFLNYLIIILGIGIFIFGLFRHATQEIFVERGGEIITARKFKLDKKSTLILIISLITIIFGLTLRITSGQNYMLAYNSITDKYYLYKGGINFHIPIINEISIYDIRIKNFPEDKKPFTIWSSSLDGIQVGLDLRIWFSVDTNNIIKLHRSFGPENYKKIIEPELKSITKSEISKYSAIDIWTVGKQNLAENLRKALNDKLENYGIYVYSVSIEEVKVNPEFLKTIEEIAISKQKAEKLKYEIQAEELESQKRKIQAQAKAQEIEIISKALNQNPKYIDYLYVDKLSDKVQVIISDKPNFINLERK
jgi:regulator of protease activity HflC (stomatin/prohibitin superfamily)